MAAPAAVLAVKAALVATTDQRARTAVLSVVAAELTPFILIIVVLQVLCRVPPQPCQCRCGSDIPRLAIYLPRCPQSTGCILKKCGKALPTWTRC